MKEAAEVFPEMANLCKIYLVKMQDEKKQAEIPKEFLKLSNMIKGKIRDLMDMGAIDAAKEALIQLEKIVPGDYEIGVLKKEINEL